MKNAGLPSQPGGIVVYGGGFLTGVSMTKIAAKPKSKAKVAAKTAAKAVAKPKAKPQVPVKTAAKKPAAPVVSEKAKARENAMIKAKKEALETAAKEASENKKRGRTKAKEEELTAEEGLSKLGKKWASLFKKAEEEKTPAYNMRGTFEEKTSIQHKVLGWGYILSNKNDRLEVLFKDGIRFLISNYKA
jgi:hypothetical protein